MQKDIKYYFNKTDNFSKYLIYKTLNKRGDWEPSDNKKNLDLCMIGGYHRSCENYKECITKMIQNNCKNSKVAGDIPPTLIDYLFGQKLIKINNKKLLFKSIEKKFGKRDYLPITYNVNQKNISKYKSVFDGKKTFFLKPDEGFERQGQLRVKKYEDTVEHLKKFKKFKEWQLQEFIESYTKEESFLRAVCVLVIENKESSLYVSQNNEWGSIKWKEDGTINMFTSKWKFGIDGCQTVIPMKKSEYTGKPGMANEVYDKLLGKDYYKKNILPKINTIMKESFTSIGLEKIKCGKSSNELCFHIFGADIMIDRNLDVKLLEISIYPSHFANPYVECVPKEVLAKSFYNKTELEKRLKYEEKLLDEIFAVSIDKVFPTKRKLNLQVLKKVI